MFLQLCVFHAMLEHDMEEKKNSAVNVEDVESASMELASRLLAAADKYALPRRFAFKR